MPAGLHKQFYDGKLERYSGTRIPIHAGGTVANIDAELEEGGEISGRVTSQVNGEPVAGAEACAGAVADTFRTARRPTPRANTRSPGCRATNTGPFSGPGGLETEYIDQYYEEKEWPDVEPVSVTAPQKVSGIDAVAEVIRRITGTVIDKADQATAPGGERLHRLRRLRRNRTAPANTRSPNCSQAPTRSTTTPAG